MSRWCYFLLTGMVTTLVACDAGNSDVNDSTMSPETEHNTVSVTHSPATEVTNIGSAGAQVSGDKGVLTRLGTAPEKGNAVIYSSPLRSRGENVAAEDETAQKVYFDKFPSNLKQVELTDRDASGNDLETIYPDLPAYGRFDLKPHKSLVVRSEKTLQTQIEIAADKSFSVHQSGTTEAYLFRPVAF